MNKLVLQNCSKKPLLWITITLLSLCGVLFSLRFFSQAFPIVDLNLTMDREEALRKASEITRELHIGPKEYKQAASFDVESTVQNYIELEAGGPKAFGQLLKEGYYSPFTWKVRHFQEYDAHEAIIFFSPTGKPYGFTQKIPENEPGKSLAAEQARKIALDQASRFWNINFDLYKPVETSQEVTSSGRIDHTFVYERRDQKVGNAPYRLKLIVRGDRVTKVKLGVKVPETFKQKYREMRSSNDVIALTATILMILLYIFCGCFLGLFFLMRLHWLEWRWPLWCALVIGSLQALVLLNEFPLLWFSYDTAVSLQQFMGQIILRVVLVFFMYTGIATLLIMVAEGLTRRAFPHTIQLWKIWGHTSGSSWQVLGRTIIGYLMIGFHFAYSICLYYITVRYFGWWSPAEALYSPDTLATIFPWLSPIALSLGAGFLEECLFRAIPLAGAALLGDRFGKRPLFIAIAFIVQAIIFGGVHANYPAQPAYARLVELIIPSFVFGFLYLFFGLLPAIISHFIFDVVWFALPIFVSHAPGIIDDKLIIVFFCLLPLLIVLYRRFRYGAWIEIPKHYYNNAWKPVIKHHKEVVHEQREHIYFTRKRFIAVSVTGLVAAAAWIVCTRFSYDTLPINLTRTQAINAAQKIDSISNERTPLAMIEVPLQTKDRTQHIYIWRTLGADVYKKLLNHYLMPALWKVRLVYFNGDLEKRADEYSAYINSSPDTSVYRLQHKVPEARLGQSLSLEEARKLAHTFIKNTYAVPADSLYEISAVPKQQPNRIDWTFIFNDLSQSIEKGQARISVEISGDEISDFYRYIFVPEQWEREYKNKNSLVVLTQMVSYFLFILLLICAGVLIIFFSKHLFGFDVKIYVSIMIMLLLKSCIQSFNIWPMATAPFNTTEPFSHQAWYVITFWFVTAIFLSNAYGVAAGFLQKVYFKSAQLYGSLVRFLLIGIVFGLVYGAFHSLVKRSFVAPNPEWPNLAPVGAYIPSLSQALIMVTQYVEMTLAVLLIIAAVDYCTQGWEKRHWLGVLIFIIFALTTTDCSSFANVWLWLAISISLAVVVTISYIYLVRHCRAAIPCITATIISLSLVPSIIAHTYPGVVLGGILGSIGVFLLGVYWSYQLMINKS